MPDELGQLREFQAMEDVDFALLTAGIAVRLDGEASLKDHPDPSSGKPFVYRKVSGGYELESSFRYKGEPRKLTFAPKAEETGL